MFGTSGATLAGIRVLNDGRQSWSAYRTRTGTGVGTADAALAENWLPTSTLRGCQAKTE